MAANPNPAYITDAMWRLWEESLKVIPGVRLGGIYANKSGYHNTVDANQAYWPGSYSVQCAADLTDPQTKARAIDLTMDDAQMKLRSGYLYAASQANDPRLHCLRSWIGSRDTRTVDCFIHDGETQPFRYDGGRDESHTWHIHGSFFTRYVATWQGALDGFLSVLKGESATQGGDNIMFCSYGDTGQVVEAMQVLIREADAQLLPQFGVDGDYGNETAEALIQLGVVGGDGSGHRYGPTEYGKLFSRVARAQG
jgi:hypothetical protein